MLMGSFDMLPADILASILSLLTGKVGHARIQHRAVMICTACRIGRNLFNKSYLYSKQHQRSFPVQELVRLGSACKGLLAACSEGELWQAMMKRDYPASQITASRACDWKHAYMLQSNNIVGELQCYYSKASFEDEVRRPCLSI